MTKKNLQLDTVDLSKGFPFVSIFVYDAVKCPQLARKLKENGVKVLLLRSTGFDHVDVPLMRSLDILVCNVPAYSPDSIAELAVCTTLSLLRKIEGTQILIREGQFDTPSRFLGECVSSKTIGVVGTGNIGKLTAQIFKGFGAKVLAFTMHLDQPWADAVGVEYVRTLEELLERSDVVTLHVPGSAENKYLLSSENLKLMKKGAYLVNTARGNLINLFDLFDSLQNGHLGGAAFDVFEFEKELFAGQICPLTEIFNELRKMENVMITAHQGWFTKEAQQSIFATTFKNLEDFVLSGKIKNQV